MTSRRVALSTSFQFFLSCIAPDRTLTPFRTQELSILSELHQGDLVLRHAFDVDMNFQFFLSCISEVASTLGLAWGAVYNYILSILSELHHVVYETFTASALILSILSELHPKFFARAWFICLTFDFIKKSAKLP